MFDNYGKDRANKLFGDDFGSFREKVGARSDSLAKKGKGRKSAGILTMPDGDTMQYGKLSPEAIREMAKVILGATPVKWTDGLLKEERTLQYMVKMVQAIEDVLGDAMEDADHAQEALAMMALCIATGDNYLQIVKDDSLAIAEEKAKGLADR